MKPKLDKVRPHPSQNEGLIFERSSPGKSAYKLPDLDVPDVDAAKLLGASVRTDLGNMPEVSEFEIIRHFTRLSTWNYAIDLGMYPLGSCTMKYNARVNEVVARIEGLANAHPYQPLKISQGALRIMKLLSEYLLDITGMDAITLQPAAHPRLSRVKGQSAQKDPDARFRARHQPGNRRHLRISGREPEIERARHG
jgi:glycine dehydrogenase subunit 2